MGRKRRFEGASLSTSGNLRQERNSVAFFSLLFKSQHPPSLYSLDSPDTTLCPKAMAPGYLGQDCIFPVNHFTA